MNYAAGIRFGQALELVRAAGIERRLGSERVALRAARGRVLSAAIRAPIALPPFDNSAMDGFALRSSDLAADRDTELRLVGERFAGAGPAAALAAGQCIRITTGAPLPDGADAVVIKEQARVEGDRVRVGPGLPPGANVRRRGEDVRAGASLLAPGSTLGSAALGLLGAIGLDGVDVARRPSVAVFTSGDELRPQGVTLAAGEIHDSNRILLQSLLGEEGIDTLSWPALRDEAGAIAAAIEDAARAYDLILTCGGVSAGERDLLPGLLERHGRIRFWKVRMRPGMPVLFGEWGSALLVGLPGNPVSVLATFRGLVLPLLDAMQGRCDRPPRLRARLAAPVGKNHDRLEFRRARLWCDSDGCLHVRAHPASGSHQQHGVVESNALLVLPEDGRDFDAGECLDIEPYGAILRA